MKWLLFIALFIVGAAVGMAIVPLLPNPIQKGIASFHLEIKHQVGIEERPDEMALSPTPTLGPGVTASPLSTSTPTPTTLPRVRVSLLPTPTSSPSPLLRVVVEPTPTPTPTPTITPTPEPRRGSEEWIEKLTIKMHQLVNDERERAGMNPLSYDDDLERIAYAHSADMAEHRYFSHTNTQGQNSTDRGNEVGYFCRKDYGAYYTEGLGENIHQGWLYDYYRTTNGVVTYKNYVPLERLALSIVLDWMGSPGHRKNLLDKGYDREGLGIYVTSDEQILTTQNLC